jgi:hypothetical protein
VLSFVQEQRKDDKLISHRTIQFQVSEIASLMEVAQHEFEASIASAISF